MNEQQQAAMRQALEAMEVINSSDNDRDFLHSDECEALWVAIDTIREALAEQPAQGCEFCSHPLYAGTKCKNCGREQPAIKQDLTPEQPAQQQEPICKLFGTLPVYDRPAKQQEPEPLTGETNVELGFYSNDASNGQQRKLAGKVEMGQLVGNRAHESASNPDAEREIAVITGVDEYGPMLGWFKHWINYPVGTKLYTSPPAQQQEPVAWLIWLHGPAGLFNHRQFAELEFERRNKEYPDPDRKLFPLYTSPPASKPWVGLTDDERDECVVAADEAAVNKPLIFWSEHHYDAIEAKLREKNEPREKNTSLCKPLTDEQIKKADHHKVEGAYDYSFAQGVRFAEAAHGITGETQ